MQILTRSILLETPPQLRLRTGVERDWLTSPEDAVVGKVSTNEHGFKFQVVKVLGEYKKKAPAPLDKEHEAHKARLIEISHRNGVE